ncbi:MAG: thioredoxin family protein [Candidatus Margulisiibacteriota bacterium]
MSILIHDEKELNECLKAVPKLAVLFYASWCPFSRKFLPIFEKHSTGKENNYRRVVLDDLEELAEKYNIEVYPTVLYFEKGKAVKRLDGIHEVGLDEDQLEDFISACKLPS